MQYQSGYRVMDANLDLYLCDYIGGASSNSLIWRWGV